jgi:hypothetical protein
LYFCKRHEVLSTRYDRKKRSSGGNDCGGMSRCRDLRYSRGAISMLTFMMLLAIHVLFHLSFLWAGLAPCCQKSEVNA